MGKLFGIISLLVFLPSLAASPSSGQHLSLVMIDTANDMEQAGRIKMPAANCLLTEANWCVHGNQMVSSLKDMAEKLRLKPVQAKMLAWSNDDDLIRDIYLAANKKPRVISMSLAGPEEFGPEKRAVKYANDNGILILAASGNDGLNHPEYPSAYGFDCLVSVSTTENGKKVSTANDGDIYIPRSGSENGTSFSTARAAAIAIKYFEAFPYADCKSAKQALIQIFGKP